MKRHHLVLFLLLLLFPLLVRAQEAGIGNITSKLQQQQNVYAFATDKAEVRLEFCSPVMFRVRSSWEKKFAPDEPYMVVKYSWPPSGKSRKPTLCQAFFWVEGG